MSGNGLQYTFGSSTPLSAAILAILRGFIIICGEFLDRFTLLFLMLGVSWRLCYDAVFCVESSFPLTASLTPLTGVRQGVLVLAWTVPQRLFYTSFSVGSSLKALYAVFRVESSLAALLF